MPTTPFKTAAMIDQAVDMLGADKTLTSLGTVILSEGVFHPYWMFRDYKGSLKPFINDIDLKKYYQRQLLPMCYRMNGVVDVFRVS